MLQYMDCTWSRVMDTCDYMLAWWCVSRADGRRSTAYPLLSADSGHVSCVVRCWRDPVCLLHWLSAADWEMPSAAAAAASSDSCSTCQQSATQLLWTTATWQYVLQLMSHTCRSVCFTLVLLLLSKTIILQFALCGWSCFHLYWCLFCESFIVRGSWISWLVLNCYYTVSGKKWNQ